MPSDKYKTAYKEALAQAKSNVLLLETIEIVSFASSTEVKDVDVCFVADTSGSMGPVMVWLADAMDGVLSALSSNFETVRFALITYGQTAGSGKPIVQSQFTTDGSQIAAILDNLSAAGNSEPVFDAVASAIDSLSWNSEFNVRRHLVVITDEPGDTPGDGNTATEAGVLEGLQSDRIVVNQTYTENNTSTALHRLMTATDGTYVRATEAEIEPDIIAALTRRIVIDTSLEPIYMIQARQPYELRLETGEWQVFEPVGFRFSLPGQNDQGLRDLNLSIDNVDRRIGKWVEAASTYNTPALARYRPYLSTDLTIPQMDPPLTLVLSDLKRTAFEVSGRASVADIVNLRFLRTLYLRSRFPSLGNT